jgi:hypothetical protein
LLSITSGVGKIDASCLGERASDELRSAGRWSVVVILLVCSAFLDPAVAF